jgi:hypothetical protein
LIQKNTKFLNPFLDALAFLRGNPLGLLMPPSHRGRIWKRLTILMLSLLAVFSTLSGLGQPVFTSTIHTLPVLIQIQVPNGAIYGSGCYLTESNNMYLVTAAHAIFQVISNRFSDTLISPNAQLFSDPKELDGRLSLQLNLGILQAKGLVKHHAYRDIAVICIGRQMPGGVLFDDAIQFQKNPTNAVIVTYLADEICRLFDDVSVGNDTYVLGYPISLLKPTAVEIDFSHALVRKGVISQKNQFTRKIIVDSAVFGGNSGGPVLIVEHPNNGQIVFKLVGIVTQYVPIETMVDLTPAMTNSASVNVNSGYGIVEPIDFALEIMHQFPSH